MSTFFVHSESMMNSEGLEHKLFYRAVMERPTKHVELPSAKNHLFSFESQSVMTQETEQKIEMFCPNPLCRVMQYFEGSHDCIHCGGKQRFVNNNLDGKTINGMEGEALETEKHYELEMFPADWVFENGARVNKDEVEPVEPIGWFEHQNLIKQSAKKVFSKAKWKAEKVTANVFASEKDLKMCEYVTHGVHCESEVKFEDQCRSGCNRPHIHNTALKWKVSSQIPEDYWKQREKAIENANKKREREQQHISPETLKWVKIYANKYSRIEMFDFAKLSEQDGRSLTWEFNTKSNKNANVENAIRVLVRKCGNPFKH